MALGAVLISLSLAVLGAGVIGASYGAIGAFVMYAGLGTLALIGIALISAAVGRND